jgi:tetratricopeptide (TPR) repeat protein
VYQQGRDDEALELTRLAERSAAADDIDAQVFWRSVRAPILGRIGSTEEAEAMARLSLELARTTELPDLHASALVALATVMRQADQADAAREALDEAIAIYEKKGDLASAQRASALVNGE